jgi:hypothetical protein
MKSATGTKWGQCGAGQEIQGNIRSSWIRALVYMKKQGLQHMA